MSSLKDSHWTQEIALDLSIQRESFLEIEVQQLNSKLLAKDDELTIMERDKGLTDLEDHLALKSEFTAWSVWRYSHKQVKADMDDIDAKILEGQELEVATPYNLPPSPWKSLASLTGFLEEEEESSNLDLDISAPSPLVALLSFPSSGL
ncbi:hypothetical protein HAX54_020597 [Datura stramonium]|uniref:Uncharacterized protein n=1 Tax=Datura stramonium TaxID=4076 RepID=A0ABS8URD2_DATST|nr:hypothetical protein [Datura stramonium]